PLKTGFAFLPVAFVIGVVSQINAKLMPRLGPKPLMITGTTLLTLALFWFSTVDKGSSYAGKLLPGMFVLAVAMGCLFVPLTVTAVSNVANTDAGLASALLNVGQQVGGALGLSVMTTVFGTAAKNWSADHVQGLLAQVPNKADIGAVGQFLQQHGQNAEPKDIQAFVQAHPSTGSFFAQGGPFNEFVRSLLAHASGEGFLMGAIIGVVAVIAAVVLINVKKTDLPTDSPEAVAVG
ncbi:MAG TPA: MFS transporter, partial [Jatrophihabitantaceae bacterium]|nr:MFS transporter [Jatrophihabitantaceae bacterium]